MTHAGTVISRIAFHSVTSRTASAARRRRFLRARALRIYVISSSHEVLPYSVLRSSRKLLYLVKRGSLTVLSVASEYTLRNYITKRRGKYAVRSARSVIRELSAENSLFPSPTVFSSFPSLSLFFFYSIGRSPENATGKIKLHYRKLLRRPLPLSFANSLRPTQHHN